MKQHVKLYEEFHSIEEVFSKQSKHYGYSEERVGDSLKKFWAGILGLVSESPVAFELEQGQEYISINGPFGISMRFGFDEKKKVFYVKSDRFSLENASAEALFREAKKSMEFKYLLKGSKIEKLKADRVKKILKSISGDPSIDVSKVIDFLYFSEAVKMVNKADTSGPWSTSGTSVDTYVYDLEPLVDDIDINELKDVLMENKSAIVEKLGHTASGIMSKRILEYEVKSDSLYIKVETHIYYN